MDANSLFVKLKWNVEKLKTNGSPRKHTDRWSVPQRFRDACFIPDRTILKVVMAFAGKRNDMTVRLTSGGSFRIPSDKKQELESFWQEEPSSEVTFEISLEDVARSPNDLFASKAYLGFKIDEDLVNPPQQMFSLVRLFRRSAVVRRTVLERANGACEVCKSYAPFITASGEPYLEVHHLEWLSRGGKDSVQNARALCPNCHREAHLGNQEAWLRNVSKNGS